MEHRAKSIRPFIGAKNFELSQKFYHELGFQKSILTDKMSFFETEGIGFYLQDAYLQEWIDNTMIFLEVDNVDRYWNQLVSLELTATYERVKLTPIRQYDWEKNVLCTIPPASCGTLGNFINKIIRNRHVFYFLSAIHVNLRGINKKPIG